VGTGEGRKGRGGNCRGGWRGRTCESCRRTQPRRLAWSSPGRSPVNVRRGARAGQTRSAWRGWKSGGEAFSRKRRTFFPSGLPPLLPFAPLPSFPKAPLVVPKGLLPAGFFAVVLPIVAVGARDVNAGRRQNIVAEEKPRRHADSRHRVFSESRRYFSAGGRQKTSRELLVTSRAASAVVSPRPHRTHGRLGTRVHPRRGRSDPGADSENVRRAVGGGNLRRDS
jgi:hypothetical protein